MYSTIIKGERKQHGNMAYWSDKYVASKYVNPLFKLIPSKWYNIKMYASERLISVVDVGWKLLMPTSLE